MNSPQQQRRHSKGHGDQDMEIQYVPKPRKNTKDSLNSSIDSSDSQNFQPIQNQSTKKFLLEVPSPTKSRGASPRGPSPLVSQYIEDIVAKSDAESSVASDNEDIELEEVLSQKSGKDLHNMVKYLLKKKIEEGRQSITLEEEKHENEVKKLCKDRHYFVFQEKLVNEDDTTDYKNYRRDSLLTTSITNNVRRIQETAVSFLNHKGGRVYVGIEDQDCKVRGIYLTKKDRDTIQNVRYLWFKSIWPNSLDAIEIKFIPIVDKNHKQIPGLFVIKFVVKPGKPKQTYCVDKNNFSFYKRNGSSTIFVEKPEDLFRLYEERKNIPDDFKPEEWNDANEEKNLIDVDTIYSVKIFAKNITESEIQDYLVNNGIPFLLVYRDSKKAYTADFTSEELAEELKNYVNSNYKVISVDIQKNNPPASMDDYFKSS